MRKIDAILVPGGGVREGGELPLWTRRRLDRALQIQTGEELIITLSAGTVHKPPPLDSKGFPIFESAAAAKYLVQRGLDPKRILIETSSYDTIGNAFFSRVIHVDPRGLRKLLIITSDFHMPRTQVIFSWVYSLDVPTNWYELYFESVSDEGIDAEILSARIQKERESLAHLLQIKEKINTLRQFHEWLFGEHAAYSLHADAVRVTGKVLNTY